MGASRQHDATKSPYAGHLFERGGCQPTVAGCFVVAWSGAMEADLQTKVEKYEGKAAKCKEWAEQAKEGPQRALYEVLAGYYGDLATDFRQVIAKRTVA